MTRLLPVALLTICTAAASFDIAVADAPLAPTPVTVCSLSGKVCASRDARGRVVVVWRRLAGSGRRDLWQAPTPLANAQVADDGRSLVAAYPGANLLAADAGPTTPVLTFYRPGCPPVVVTLGQIVANPGELPRTASHRLWVRAYGYDGHGGYVVDTIDGRHLVYDPASGRLVRESSAGRGR